jgi:hypothetical protein
MFSFVSEHKNRTQTHPPLGGVCVVCSVHGAVLAPGLGLIPICAFALIPSGRETQILHRAGAGKWQGQIAAPLRALIRQRAGCA